MVDQPCEKAASPLLTHSTMEQREVIEYKWRQYAGNS